jgi:hypothetical protein
MGCCFEKNCSTDFAKQFKASSVLKILKKSLFLNKLEQKPCN